MYGDLFWNKVSGWTNALYQGGFTNSQTVEGSGYIKPPLLTPVLSNTVMTAVLADGNLPDSITNGATLSIILNNKIFFTNATPPVNPNGIKGNLSAARGEFSGSFTNPASSAKTPIKGVALQGSGDGAIRGSFVGTNQSGSIRIAP